MTTDSAEWMRAIWGALPSTNIVETTVKTPSWWITKHATVDEMIAEAETGTYASLAARGFDVYAGMVGLSQVPPPGANGLPSRGPSSLRNYGGCLWMDVDCVAPGRGKQNLFESVDEALDSLDALGDRLGIGPPDVVVHSGWGVHVAWLLSEPTPPPYLSSAIRTIENALMESTGKHVDHVGDAPRVLRVPGTLNRRGGETPVRLVRCDTSRRRTWNDVRFALSLSDEVLSRHVAAGASRGGGKFSLENRALMDVGSLFEASTTWADVLSPFGWSQVSSNEYEESWLRPGKEDDRSFGERSGVVYSDNPGLLVVFTDAPTGLTSLRGTSNRVGAGIGSIDRWSAWVDLMWNGNMKEATNDALTRALEAEGDLGTWPGDFMDELTQEVSLAMSWAVASRVRATDRWARGLD